MRSLFNEAPATLRGCLQQLALPKFTIIVDIYLNPPELFCQCVVLVQAVTVFAVRSYRVANGICIHCDCLRFLNFKYLSSLFGNSFGESHMGQTLQSLQFFNTNVVLEPIGIVS